MNATVTALHIATIKGTQLRSVDGVELDERGAAGDRKFYVVDERARMQNGKQLGELQAVVASLDGDQLAVRFPDGTVVDGEVELADAVPTQFFSHTVPGHPVKGAWSQALSDYAGRSLRLMGTGSAVDRGAKGPVSLMSRGSLRRLAEQAGTESVDGRRFRMLIEVDGVEPHAEDAWMGQPIDVGGARLRFDGHVGRCLVTSRDPESGVINLPTLDLLREYRAGIETTEPLPFGIYGRVLRGGSVRVGDRLEFA
jgi:uncharacterized protein